MGFVDNVNIVAANIANSIGENIGVLSLNRATIADMTAIPNPSTDLTCIVTDNNQGGTFVYDSTQSTVNNGGTVFNGWIRQDTEKVLCKWFGATDSNGVESGPDQSTYVQKALNYAFLNGKELVIDGNYTIGTTLTLPQNNTKYVNPILKISGYGSAMNYSNDNHQSTLNLKDGVGDIIILDLRYQCTIPTRFSIILTDFNVTGRNTAEACGIYISNAWTTIDRVCVNGIKEGIILNELYKSSIINSSISNNQFGIVYSGYNSVVNVTGCELRNNKRNGNGASFYLKTSSRKITGEIGNSVAQISQAHIAGNNFESTVNLFEMVDDTCGMYGVAYLGNYDEACDYLIKKSCTNTLIRECSFTEIKYDMKVDLDYTGGITFSGGIGNITTTDATGYIDFKDLPSYFNTKNYLRNTNRLFYKGNINKDYDFSLQSRVLNPLTLPSDMGNSNVGSYCSWETDDANRFRAGKTCLKIDNTSSDTKYLRWDWQSKGVKSFYNMNTNYAYRIKVAYTYHLSADKTIKFKTMMPGTSSESINYRAGKAGWNTDSFTINALPDQADNNAYLKMDIEGGDTMYLDTFIISYVSNPELVPETVGTVSHSIPSNDKIDLTIDNWDTSLNFSVQGDQDINYWLTRDDSDNILSVHQGDSGNTSYPNITYIEIVPRKV